MATRGRKPTATVIKLVTGNPGRRPLPKHEPKAEGRPIKPAIMSETARRLWDRVSGYLWLSEPDSWLLHVWCELQGEFEEAPGLMIASRIAQLRALGAELGLAGPASRLRVGTVKENEKADPAAKYF